MEVPTFLAWFCYSVFLIISLRLSDSTLLRTSDRFALLAIKSQVSSDPLGALSSWNDSSHHCDWRGITCSLRHPDRVTDLELQSQKLAGTLSPYISNLTFLRNIVLDDNNFHGVIPQEIVCLFRLRMLVLANNSFVGGIPAHLSNCSDLRIVGLRGNKLSGNIWANLSSLSKLDTLSLARNGFTGNIPSSFGNLSSLSQLSLSENHLEGSIPASLCAIRSLSFFRVGTNNLTGKVPSCLYNHSEITYFSVAFNELHGSFPSTIGLTLPKIREIYAASNYFSGLIPSSLSNATTLEVAEFGINSLTGPVPRDLGRLQSLHALLLSENKLSDNLEFITSLTNCTKLEALILDGNFFQGSFPDSVSNLSTRFKILTAERNEIYGIIPPGVENLINVERIYLTYNYLTGNIVVLGKLGEISEILLGGNKFSGQIPASLGNLTKLTLLQLAENSFSGSIPSSLGNLSNLQGLDLSKNALTGIIPEAIVGLSSLILGLYLNKNNLTGSLPLQVGNLTNTEVLDISDNKLSGHIPESLGKCLNLKHLFVGNNLFDGPIPLSLSTLRGLEYFDLSRNRLCGEIPEYLAGLPLLNLNLSFNHLEGLVPDAGVFQNASAVSVVGNAKLCGGLGKLKLPPCITKTKKSSFPAKMVVTIIVGGASLLAFSCFLLLCYQRKRMRRNTSPPTLFNHSFKRVSYSELLKATNGFSSDNLIGGGSYGSVFKGTLENIGQIVAVKVLNLQREGASKSFLTECNALRNLRHRCLLKVITACSSVDFQGKDFKALVFEFMPNGNLDEWLHPSPGEHRNEARYLSFRQRLNIAIDVASALEYLHHHCTSRTIHRDLKPSNVLLNDDMSARVADFGLAKIFAATSFESVHSQSNTNAIKGSIGYVAPEYGMGGEVSTAGDVYSYGILLLEMFTSKRPTDDMFLNGIGLHNYSKMALRDQVMKIVDPMLVDATVLEDVDQSKLQKCLGSLIGLGVACSAESPVERMTMSEVVAQLHHIRNQC